MHARRRRALTVLAALAAVGLASLAAAQSAAAHVTVSSTDAVQGGYAVLTFQVPTESKTASTTAVTVALPTDHPIASVSVQPHPGWSFTTRTTKLHPPVRTDDGVVTEAVSQIRWKADRAASAIAPGEFDQFQISAGPLPKVGSLTFPVIQTYSDGTVVRWIEQPAPGSTAEPDHPAPTLQLAPQLATAASGAATDSTAPGSGLAPGRSGSGKASTAAATTGIVLGIVGVLLGSSALVLAVRRRPADRTLPPPG